MNTYFALIPRICHRVLRRVPRSLCYSLAEYLIGSFILLSIKKIRLREFRFSERILFFLDYLAHFRVSLIALRAER